MPISDCTLVNTTDNVICYEFVFDMVGGFSSAIAVVIFSAIYFNMNLTILSCLKNNRCRGYKTCYYIGVMIIFFIPLGIIAISIIVITLYFDFFFKSYLFTYQVVVYCIAIGLLALLSVIMSCAIREYMCLADFEHLSLNEEAFFYTHTHGYKMCVSVEQEENSNYTINTYLMNGPFNDILRWPFRGEITIQIRNQRGDHDHITRTIPYNDETPVEASRVLPNNVRSNAWNNNIIWKLQNNPGRKIRYMSDEDTLHLCVIKVV